MKLRVLSPANEEIAEAVAWYNAQRVGLGDELWRSLDDTLALIEEDPYRFGKSEFATQEIDFRVAVIKRFKYVIHFAIEADEVQVVSVAHGARLPGYWRLRAKK